MNTPIYRAKKIDSDECVEGYYEGWQGTKSNRDTKMSIATTQELYGISPKELTEMNYKQAIETKIQGAKLILVDLLKPHYMERNAHRINQVNKAIKFNQQLLAELNLCYAKDGMSTQELRSSTLTDLLNQNQK